MLRLISILSALTCCSQTANLELDIFTSSNHSFSQNVTSLRISLSSPKLVETTTLGPDGFTATLNVSADDIAGFVMVEALDATDSVIAWGRTPPLPTGGVDATLPLYLAPPSSAGFTPVDLGIDEQPGLAPTNFGAAIIGGKSAGTTVTNNAIYNSFTHALQEGLPLPQATFSPSVHTIGEVLLIWGGENNDGPIDQGMWFDTRVSPAGQFTPIAAPAASGGAGRGLVTYELNRAAIGGSPALGVAALTTNTESLSTDLAGPAATITTSETTKAFFLGDAIIAPALFDGDTWQTLGVPVGLPREQACLVSFGDKIAIFGGATPSDSVWIFSSDTLMFAETTAVLPAVMAACDAASGERYVAVYPHAGDRVELLRISSAELVFDATVDITPAKPQAKIETLNNDLFLVAGGGSAEGRLVLPSTPPTI